MKKVLLLLSLILLTTGCTLFKVDINANIPDINTSITTSTNDEDVENNENPMTLEEYNKLETGMTIEEVTEIVGDKCSKTGTIKSNGVTTATYICYGNTTSSVANLTFQNDKLTIKMQVGLE